jgi:hypothetical protein
MVASDTSGLEVLEEDEVMEVMAVLLLILLFELEVLLLLLLLPEVLSPVGVLARSAVITSANMSSKSASV